MHQHPLQRLFAMESAVLAMALAFLLPALSSCSRDDSGTEPVAWPELARFDEIAYRADGLVRTGDAEAVEELRPELLESGQALTPETIPANASDRRQVEAILADLTSLIDGLAAETDPESSNTLVLGMHPVIETLMKAAGMPHVHANEGPNDGFLHPVFDSDGAQIGTAEIKLHDDAGDLEVWLTQGGRGGEPWRWPVDTTLTLSFPALEQEVSLAVRDPESNEDESGTPTVVDGTTAYFVFPGETGADASWLMGPDFAAKAELRVDQATTGPLVLRPHIHREDGDGEA